MSVSPTGLAQVAIAVRDLDRARAFYRDTLGLAHLFDAPPGLAFFACGETRLMLSLPEGPETAGNSILYYAVADVQAAERALADAGVPIEEPARCIAKMEGREVWLSVARDSEGNLFGLMQG